MPKYAMDFFNCNAELLTVSQADEAERKLVEKDRREYEAAMKAQGVVSTASNQNFDGTVLKE